MNFKNKKILITGGTGGIGNALVKKFIELGGSVLATGTKIDKLDELKKILTEFLQKNLTYLNIQILKILSKISTRNSVE